MYLAIPEYEKAIQRIAAVLRSDTNMELVEKDKGLNTFDASYWGMLYFNIPKEKVLEDIIVEQGRHLSEQLKKNV